MSAIAIPKGETGGGLHSFPADQPLRLDSGALLSPLLIAYKTARILFTGFGAR